MWENRLQMTVFDLISSQWASIGKTRRSVFAEERRKRDDLHNGSGFTSRSLLTLRRNRSDYSWEYSAVTVFSRCSDFNTAITRAARLRRYSKWRQQHIVMQCALAIISIAHSYQCQSHHDRIKIKIPRASCVSRISINKMMYIGCCSSDTVNHVLLSGWITSWDSVVLFCFSFSLICLSTQY